MINTKNLGTIGEKEAVKYLINKGYCILEINWRYLHKEIDIIAKTNNIICIIEVKTRSSNFTKPSDAVTKKKQKHLIFAANEYLQDKDLDNDVRFDIIEIMYNNKKFLINHILDAFYPSLS